jgi:Flp pilus assembly protein TadB
MTIWILLALLLVGTSLRPVPVLLAWVAGVAAAGAPLLLIPGGMAAGIYVVLRRIRVRTAERDQQREDAALLADLTALALTGGLGIRPALEIAAGAVGGPVAVEVESLLRRARVDGMAAVMTGAGGAGKELYRVVGRSIATGAPLVDQVARIADEMHADNGARKLEQVRRVPVAMLFPLTLLILPGFLLMTIAPALLDAFLHLEL